MGNGLLIYVMAQHLLASHGGVIRCITPDPALLTTWKNCPATGQNLRSYENGACGMRRAFGVVSVGGKRHSQSKLSDLISRLLKSIKQDVGNW